MEIIWFAIFVSFILSTINAIVIYTGLAWYGTNEEQIGELKVMRFMSIILGSIILGRILTELSL